VYGAKYLSSNAINYDRLILMSDLDLFSIKLSKSLQRWKTVFRKNWFDKKKENSKKKIYLGKLQKLK